MDNFTFGNLRKTGSILERIVIHDSYRYNDLTL